ncbi:MAG TPA: hypothetical protein VFL36_09795 [Myxococcales bacterium]|nr:hypothetical protein [Myxococcales bacterium]
MSEAASTTGFKFAALVLPSASGPTESRNVHPGKETFVGTISSLVAAEELAHWREWMGTIAWDDLDSPGRVVLLRAPAPAPAALDDGNQRLLGKVTNSWHAFLLSRPPVNEVGESWLLSGETSGDTPGSSLVRVRTTSRIDTIVRPMFATRRQFSDIEAEDLRRHWETFGRRDDS